MRPLVYVSLSILFLVSCAGPQARLSPGSFPERARQLLEEEAEKGRVALVVRTSISDAEDLANAAADGVRGMAVHFDPSPGVDAHYRLIVSDKLGDPCSDDKANPGDLNVAFCRGNETVASVVFDRDVGDVEMAELVRRATRQIFPDPYAHGPSTGVFGTLGTGVSIGGGVTFGF